jgi:hypothetical protein
MLIVGAKDYPHHNRAPSKCNQRLCFLNSESGLIVSKAPNTVVPAVAFHKRKVAQFV